MRRISSAFVCGLAFLVVLMTSSVAFADAQYAFADSHRVIAEDINHSDSEERYYCFGKVGDGILTVRFTYRNEVIRIIGAGYWRKGKAIYEHENKVHR